PLSREPRPARAGRSGMRAPPAAARARKPASRASRCRSCASRAERPWERPPAIPARIASALDIMLDGPIGAASFNNEFGRPAICGYFRTFELAAPGDRHGRVRGYHKPIMIAGGLGNIRRPHVEKSDVPVGAKLIVLGGPAMLIGLGGGAASSVGSGASSADLDFASVQRGNAEIQRRAQETIDG